MSVHPPFDAARAAEPVHVRGAIQPPGAVLAIDPNGFTVTQASANLATILGTSAAEALGMPAPALFGTIWPAAIAALAATQGISTESTAVPGPIRVPAGNGRPPYMLALRQNPCGRIRAELEPVLSPSPDSLMPLLPAVLAALRQAPTMGQLCATACRELRRLTGHGRVAVYRVAAGGIQDLIAEDPAPDLESFLGLRHPIATAPPGPSRTNPAHRARYIPDAASQPIPILRRRQPANPPLDLTTCIWRHIAPAYLGHLRTIGVQAELAVTIPAQDGGAWGLLLCHAAQPLHVPAPLRAFADLIVQTVSVTLAAMAHAETRLAQRARERHIGGLIAAMDKAELTVSEAMVQAEAELSRLRQQDQLTGLPNRRMLLERLDALGEAQAAGHAVDAALLYIDLDRFANINDLLGHGAGDALLIQVAARLTAKFGRRHMLARTGSDEFAILCEATSPAAAKALADEVRTVLRPPFDMTGHPYLVTASIGIAHSAATGRSGPSLLQASDAAVQAARREGGDTSATYAEALRTETTRRFVLEQDLRIALANGGAGLHLAFQPIISVHTGALAGFEALARWRHPELGPLSPTTFVPVAESAGLHASFGNWVIETALDQATLWQAAMRPGHPAPYVSVNVSPRQLATADFPARIRQALATRTLPPAAIQIEVTEAIVADAFATRTLAGLRALGVQVAIDDFGTGYSSLSYLRDLPATVVKLDRSFLPGLKGEDDPAQLAADKAFMGAVIGVAQHAGLATVGEGVETPTQLDAIRQAGVDWVQGFLCARPLTPADALQAVAALGTGQPMSWHHVFSGPTLP